VTNPEEATELAALLDAYRRWETAPPLTMQMGFHDAWLLMSCVQMASKHPAVSARIVALMRHAGEAIQGAVCDTPELQAIAAQGWEDLLTMEGPPPPGDPGPRLAGTGVFHGSERVRPELLEPDRPGEHVWIVTVAYRVTAETLTGPAEAYLDQESFAAMQAGCYVCEQPFEKRLTHRRCPGEPG